VITIQKTDKRAYRDGIFKQAVLDGQRLLGHVYKDERTHHVMAKDGNYSVGQRVEQGWRFEAANLHDSVRRLDSIADRDRFRRLGRGFERTRKAAIKELVDFTRRLDETLAWVEKSRG